MRKIAADGSSAATRGAAGGQIENVAVDFARTIFYFDPSGLRMLGAGASSSTLLIPATTGSNVLCWPHGGTSLQEHGP